MNELRKRTAIALAGGFAGVLLVSSLRGLWTAGTGAEAFSALCDGFFVTAVLLGGMGLLDFVRNQGAFDAAFFGIRKVFQLKWPGLGDWREEYREYLARKKARRKSPRPLLTAGAVYLVLAFAALGAYLLWKA